MDHIDLKQGMLEKFRQKRWVLLFLLLRLALIPLSYFCMSIGWSPWVVIVVMIITWIGLSYLGYQFDD